MDNSKVFAMKLSKVYPLLVDKAQRKGRTVQEVEEVLFWLTGYDKAGLDAQLARDVDYSTFFEEAPCMNPNCPEDEYDGYSEGMFSGFKNVFVD